MEIALHLGANCTDEDRLIRTILKNGAILKEHDIAAPGPGKYRRLLRETIQNLNGLPPAPDTRQIMLDSILSDETPDRMVLSNSNFICIPNRIFESGVLYAQTEFKLRGMLQLFPQDDLDIFLAIRDPATFLPDAFRKSKSETFEEFMAGKDPFDIRWSDMIERILQVAPHLTLTVWCNEDTPLIWDEIVLALTGLPQDTKINGAHDLLATIMSNEGMNRYINYLNAHPPKTLSQKRRVIAAFLDKYALDEEIEETVDLPGMTADDIQELSDLYEEDVQRIAAMDGVRFIGV
ncbi:hypothetical protein SAMN05428995_1125 [Loktanella sp. DSM 29012]|uniref:hypothetical protein n=1 Tax=Loktanella sp. DSM 29012 TaxID=1881056 RepID=UPI0008C47B8F|nr:hypothetical protein [Loktanella sp. DSM 29012]SEQ86590.1 hypothetical protein SAMN05428995_1125 [Loktanella sp. DSM 29012]